MGFGSPWHWMVIGLVALLLFGGRLPEIARALGRSLNEFKRGMREVDTDFDDRPPTGSGRGPSDPEKLDQPDRNTTPGRSAPNDRARQPEETSSSSRE